MSADRYAVVDKTGAVVNVIMWDPDDDYSPGEGLELRPAKDGDTIAEPAEPPTHEQKLDELLDKLATATNLADVRKAATDAKADTKAADAKTDTAAEVKP